MKLKATVQATESNLLHEIAKVSGNYEAKMDKQHSIAMGAQESLKVKLREEISQVAHGADAHYKEEQILRKLGIENLDSKIREDILRANQDIITKLEKSWNVGRFFEEPRRGNDQGRPIW